MLPVISVVFEVVGTGLDVGTTTGAECVDVGSTSADKLEADGGVSVIEFLHRLQSKME